MNRFQYLPRVLVLTALVLLLVSADQPAKGKPGLKGAGGSQAQSQVLLPFAGSLDGRTLVGAPRLLGQAQHLV